MLKHATRARTDFALFQTRLPTAYREGLAAAAASEAMSMSAWVRQTIRQRLRARGFLPKSLGGAQPVIPPAAPEEEAA